MALCYFVERVNTQLNVSLLQVVGEILFSMKHTMNFHSVILHDKDVEHQIGVNNDHAIAYTVHGFNLLAFIEI